MDLAGALAMVIRSLPEREQAAVRRLTEERLEAVAKPPGYRLAAMPERAGRVTGPLVTPEWLRERLGDPALQIVDCRYRLGEPGAGEALWREGHIPGAAFMDLDRDLAARRASGAGIRCRTRTRSRPRPGGPASAATRWWSPTTRSARAEPHASGGCCDISATTQVTVLDGGLRGWREEGGELRGGEEQIEPGDFRAGRARRRHRGAPGRRCRRRAAVGCSSMPGRPSATAARSSRSTRSPDTFRARVNLPFAELAPGRPLPPARGAARPLRGRRRRVR